jgi:hypothetical protein
MGQFMVKGVGQFRGRPPKLPLALLEPFPRLTLGGAFFKKRNVAFDSVSRPALEPPVPGYRPDPVTDDDKAEDADNESQRGADKIDSGEKAHPELLMHPREDTLLINPKFEYRNPKQIQNPNFQMTKTKSKTVH